MAKVKTSFICQECGYSTSKWIGKCPECENWNSFSEETESPKQGGARSGGSNEGAMPIGKIFGESRERISVGLGEFDRVIGGGLVPGSLVLIGGEPGIGKSTLLGEVLGRLGQKKIGKMLYSSGEESAGQVADRMRRLGYTGDELLILNETKWQNILSQIQKIKPKVLVLDSIQTTHSTEIQSAPGTISQIREVTYELMNHVKANDITCFVVGHITKDGNIAGPKVLEHMVDTVIYFEGDQYGQYRMLRSIKNRFGNTNEVGIFEMKERGLVEVGNPTKYFIDEQLGDAYGRSISCILEGTRPLLVEIQALVVENKFGNGRRTTQGFESNRLSMMVAVLEKYLEMPLGYSDIYLNVVGGLKVSGRETDLSVLASLLSSYESKPVPDDTVFLGEVGLTGEVRSVPRTEERLNELAHLGYKTVVTSLKTQKEFCNKYVMEFLGLGQASELKKFFL